LKDGSREPENIVNTILRVSDTQKQLKRVKVIWRSTNSLPRLKDCGLLWDGVGVIECFPVDHAPPSHDDSCQCLEERIRLLLVECNVVDRAHERKLLLELVLFDQGHDLFGGQRPLQLLAVE